MLNEFLNRKSRPKAAKLQMEALEERQNPTGIFATASLAGVPASVTINDSATWATSFTVTPFSGFTGGITTAVADVNGDGTDDVIVAAGAGGGPLLAMYSGVDGSLIRTLSVGDSGDRAGISVASAGKDSSGDVLLAVGTLVNGVSTVELIKATDGTVIKSFQPFAGFTGALNVATADVNGDGTTDIIVGAGEGGAPRVAVFDGATGNTLFDSFVFETTFTGGVYVSAGDLNGDGKPDIVVSAGVLGGPRVSVYTPTTWTVLQNFFAYDSTQRDGVKATVFDNAATGGTASIVTVDGPGAGGTIAAFNATTLAPLTAPSLPGLPGGLDLTTTAPTLTSIPTSPPPISLTDDSGMTNTIPDVNSTRWVTSADGVKTWDVVVGSGTAETASSTNVEVYYSGYLLNGTLFDSDRSPKSPASFSPSGLIQGFQEGLVGMKPGGVRNIYIPSALGYGAAGSGTTIPANSDLIFQVKLISVT